METSRGRDSNLVIAELDRPGGHRQFDFFQALRLLEELHHAQHGADAIGIGKDGPPASEPVRFRAEVAHAFPASEISEFRRGDDGTPSEMFVTFIGLAGANGVLPTHYTSLLIERCHTRNRDFALRDFLDLFNHRITSLFYRAWRKYRLPFTHEQHTWSETPHEDAFRRVFLSLVGLGLPGLRHREDSFERTVIYYGGHYARRARTAVGLQMMLRDVLGAPVTLHQFVGQWLHLSPENRSAMPSPCNPDGQNVSLGLDTVLGSRVWNLQARFRITIGPVDYETFTRFMPGGDRLQGLAELIRLYVGPTLTFEIQVLLQKEEVPRCIPGKQGLECPRLGWNTWLFVDKRERDAEDAAFVFKLSSLAN